MADAVLIPSGIQGSSQDVKAYRTQLDIKKTKNKFQPIFQIEPCLKQTEVHVRKCWEANMSYELHERQSVKLTVKSKDEESVSNCNKMKQVSDAEAESRNTAWIKLEDGWMSRNTSSSKHIPPAVRKSGTLPKQPKVGFFKGCRLFSAARRTFCGECSTL